MGGVTLDNRATWQRRMDAERERRAAAQQHFGEVERSNKRWFWVKVAFSPLLVMYAVGRLAVEWVRN